MTREDWAKQECIKKGRTFIRVVGACYVYDEGPFTEMVDVIPAQVMAGLYD
jgi:hypothetical protein